MKRTLIILFICWMAAPTAHAAITVIDGTCTGFHGRSVRLSATSDFLTNRLHVLGSALIGDDGKFLLQVEIRDTTEVILSVGFRKASFFIVPGDYYRCRITVNEDSLRQVRIPVVKQELPFQLEGLSPGDINTRILSFDLVFDRFVAGLERALPGTRNRRLLDSLAGLLPQDLLPSGGSFPEVYAGYRLAGLESMVMRYDLTRQYQRYLHNKPVRYNHPLYMEFFNEFYSGYLLRKSADIAFRDLEVTVNREGSLEALTDSVGKDSLLRNERIRQLALLKNLGELYSDNRFSKENIRKIIGQLAATSKYPEHRIIAANLLESLTHLATGSQAPDFSLTTSQGVEKTLDDYRGRYVYLNFFTTWCTPCLPELKAISNMKKKFREDVSFISICADEDAFSLGHFLTSNRDMDWDICPSGDDYDLLEAYGAYAYPLFILLDRDGRIVQYPALKPSEGAEAYLLNLLTQGLPPGGKN